MNVPVGPTTVAGWGVTFTAFVTALVMYLTGHGGGTQELGIICASGAGLVVFLVTQIGRYVQAHAQVKPRPTPTVPVQLAAVPRSNLPA